MQSLRARLFAFLLALAAATSMIVGGATYASVRAEADALFDYQLRQMALSLIDQGSISADEGAALANPEFDYVVQVWSSQGVALYSSRPAALAQALPPRAVMGFSQLRLAGQDWRVYAAATAQRVVQVAQPLSVRRRLATDAALRSVMPVVVAAPLVALALWWLIGLSLAPLQRVVLAAESRGADSLQALPMLGLPSELRPLVGAFNALLARLAAAFDAQRSFVADAAHELRTPLTALKLQIGLLQTAPAGPELETAVQRLRAGVDRATHLAEQLLALARTEPGAAAPAVDLDLAEVARRTVADAQPLAERRGVRLDCRAVGPVTVRGDAQALRSALHNLVDNAMKYGARTVTVDVRAALAGWRITVDDDGPGIPAADRERVFGRFQRGRADAEGSGLGLAIVRAVARQHGAQVTLDESPAGGLRVRMSTEAAT